MRQMWCRIVGLGRTMAFGITADNEKVVVGIRAFKEIGGLERGDIVSFVPEIFRPEHPWLHPLGQPKWHALWPTLIGEAPHFTQGSEENSPAQAGEEVRTVTVPQISAGARP